MFYAIAKIDGYYLTGPMKVAGNNVDKKQY